MVHYQGTELENTQQHIGEPHLGGVFYLLQMLEESRFLRGAVFGFGDFTDDDTRHEGVVVALGSFLSADDDRCEDLVGLYFAG